MGNQPNFSKFKMHWCVKDLELFFLFKNMYSNLILTKKNMEIELICYSWHGVQKCSV